MKNVLVVGVGHTIGFLALANIISFGICHQKMCYNKKN